MSFNLALAIVLGVLGGILTYLTLGPAAHFIFIWAIFISTAMGVAIGGTPEAFGKLVICAIAGVLIAWLAAQIILRTVAGTGLPLPIYAGIIVGLATIVIVLIANIPIFATIPATVIGFAMLFAYLLHQPGTLDVKPLTSASVDNPVLPIILSIIVGALFGIVGLNLATTLSKKA